MCIWSSFLKFESVSQPLEKFGFFIKVNATVEKQGIIMAVEKKNKIQKKEQGKNEGNVRNE